MKIYDLIKSNDALNNINNVSSNIDDFNNEVKHNSAIIFVLADWCGHCQDFKPKINDYVQHMSNTNNNGIIALFDDNTMKEANNMPSINGFPSVFSMRNGMKHQDYNGERSKEGLINFSNNIFKPSNSLQVRKKVSCGRIPTPTPITTSNSIATPATRRIMKKPRIRRKLSTRRKPTMRRKLSIRRKPSTRKRPTMRRKPTIRRLSTRRPKSRTPSKKSRTPSKKTKSLSTTRRIL